LAMVYGIVQRHHGTLDIQSAMGAGTTISICLPLGNVEEIKKIPEEKLPEIKPLRILCVDDQPAILSLIADYLTQDGHRVEQAKDGAEGWAKFQAGKFDLVITDMAMPKINGEELTLAIKEMNPLQPVILLSGTSGVTPVSVPHLNGPDLLLGKPVKLQTLRQAMAQLLNRKQDFIG